MVSGGLEARWLFAALSSLSLVYLRALCLFLFLLLSRSRVFSMSLFFLYLSLVISGLFPFPLTPYDSTSLSLYISLYISLYLLLSILLLALLLPLHSLTSQSFSSEKYEINFLTAVPRPLLETLAAATAEAGTAKLIARVFDMVRQRDTAERSRQAFRFYSLFVSRIALYLTHSS